MSLRRQVGWSAGAALVLTGSRFALSVVLARRLHTAAFGQFAYAQWLVDISFLLLSLGATGAVSRYAAEFRHSTATLIAFMRQWRPYAYALPLAAAVVSIAAARLSGMVLTTPALLAMAAWTLSSGLWAMQTAALTGLQRFDLVFKANAVVAAVMLAGAIGLPRSEQETAAVFSLMAVACLAGFVVGFGEVANSARGAESPIPEEARKAIRRYAINVWITALLWSVAWSRGELPVVKAVLGDEGVAHYAVSLTLMGGAIAGVMLGIGGVAPQITRYLGEGRRDLALSLCRRLGDIHMLVCCLAGLTVIWLAPQMLTLAYGGNYVDSATSLATLGAGICVMGVSLFNHFLQITTDSRFNRNATVVGVIVLYSASVVLVGRAGIDGAALARTAALLVMTAASVLFAYVKSASDGIGVWNLFRTVGLCVLSLVTVAALGPGHVSLRFAGLLVTALLAIAASRSSDGAVVLLAEWRKVRA